MPDGHDDDELPIQQADNPFLVDDDIELMQIVVEDSGGLRWTRCIAGNHVRMRARRRLAKVKDDCTSS